jgi:DNA-binding transcriptional MerR regulator
MAMLIGELARRAGVKAQTIRYYEGLGLLSRANRSASGYRRYGLEALDELRFIRNAQSLGFSLDDVRQILDVARAGRAPCSRVLLIAEAHVVGLGRRIEQLTRLRDDLRRAVVKWKDGGRPSHCASTLCGLISEAADDSNVRSVLTANPSPRPVNDRFAPGRASLRS